MYIRDYNVIKHVNNRNQYTEIHESKSKIQIRR